MSKMTLREISDISDILIEVKKKDTRRQNNGLHVRMRKMVFDSGMYKIDISVLTESKMIWVNTAKWLPGRLI